MITLLTGKKGSGKTKKLIEMANAALEKSNGNVVVVEKGLKLTYDISHAARLIDIDAYDVKGGKGLYGFLAGICAGNYDVTDILVDSTLKITGTGAEVVDLLVNDLKKLGEGVWRQLVLSISAANEEIPFCGGICGPNKPQAVKDILWERRPWGRLSHCCLPQEGAQKILDNQCAVYYNISVRHEGERMTIDLRKYFRGEDLPGSDVLECQLDLSGMELGGVKPFCAPVRVRAELKGSPGSVELRGKACYAMTMPCDQRF